MSTLDLFVTGAGWLAFLTLYIFNSRALRQHRRLLEALCRARVAQEQCDPIDGTELQARVNLDALLSDAGQAAVITRDKSRDGGGWFGFLVRGWSARTVSVVMPGCVLDEVHGHPSNEPVLGRGRPMVKIAGSARDWGDAVALFHDMLAADYSA